MSKRDPKVDLSVNAPDTINTPARILDNFANDGSKENDEILVYKIGGRWVCDTFHERQYAVLAASQMEKKGATVAFVFNANTLMARKHEK